MPKRLASDHALLTSVIVTLTLVMAAILVLHGPGDDVVRLVPVSVEHRRPAGGDRLRLSRLVDDRRDLPRPWTLLTPSTVTSSR